MGSSSSTTITSRAAAGGVGVGWCSNRGCSGVSSVVVILILILSILIAAVVAILVSELHDELIARLDHSFQLGLLLPQLLSIFSVLLA
jgi:hypothetical protein